MSFLAVGLDLGVQSVKLVVLSPERKLIFRDSQPVRGNFFSALETIIRRNLALLSGQKLLISATGAGRNSLDFPAETFKVNEISALAAGVGLVFPGARSVFDIGAESSRWLELGKASAGDIFPEVVDFALNERCAAGTGLFLEQQAYRLRLSIEDFSSLAARARKGATIAGRCSVFAKSDMIHLQQKGTPAEEIAYGVCLALVRSVTSSLLKGKDISWPLVLAGNITKNAAVVRAFQEVLKAGPDRLLYSELSPYLPAIGAASLVLARNEENRFLAAENLLRGIRPTADHRFSSLQPLGELRASPASEPVDRINFPVRGYLGVDIGSVSTNLVVIDETGQVLSGVYLPTRGRPLEVLQEGLLELFSRFPAGLEILGIGTTGSGRYLAGRLLRADLIKNEITCQMRSACFYFPEVDTIFEIGGQDSKYIQVENGRVVDFNLNKICAAGTGSFLEEQAAQMGFRVERDFAVLASASGQPSDLGSRCTVFMESELLNEAARGQPLPDLVAGLAYSIARNYLEKVVERRPIGQNIVFQGGVASNQAVVRAFSIQLGKEIKVHPYHRISGAIGAALEAREVVRKSGKKSLGLDDIRNQLFQSFKLSHFECRQCANRCQVVSVDSGQERVYFGDICERYTSASRLEVSSDDVHKPLAFRNRLLDSLQLQKPAEGPTIGLPRASVFLEFLPFWLAFFPRLGYRVKVSPETNPEIMEAGIKLQPAETCLPVKVAIGHLKFLQDDPEVDLVFLPSLVDRHQNRRESFYFCPYTENLPHMIPETVREKLLTTSVYLEPVEDSQKLSWQNLAGLLKEPEETIARAWTEAWQVQMEFDRKLKEQGQQLLKRSFQSKRPVWLISGRPYLLYDSFVNLNFWSHLEKLKLIAIPADYLELEDLELAGEILEGSAVPPWRYPRKMLEAAAWSRKHHGVYPVFLSFYGCGPDAFCLKQCKSLVEGIPHLFLEFDEHRGEAGLITRLEAFDDEVSQHRAGNRPAARLKKAENPETWPVERVKQIPFVLPYFADHARAFAGALKKSGLRAEVLPPPDERSLELGEKYSSGKECHAYSFLLGDLLKLTLDEKPAEPLIFFFPGARYSCLLQQYGPAMRQLLHELDNQRVLLLTPTLDYFWQLIGFDGLKALYQGLVAVDHLTRISCQLRPYEVKRGEVNRAFQEGLKLIEEGLASDRLAEALEKIRSSFSQIKVRPEERPLIGIAGDIYTRQNSFANNRLFEQLEELGCEVWPSPFLVDEIDFSFSRGFYEKLSEGNLLETVKYAGLNLVREINLAQVRKKLEFSELKLKEPRFEELLRSTLAYLNYNNNQSLFLNVARMVDLARRGVDGIINVICFNCMLGTASAAISRRIKKDFGNLPLPTLVYGETETVSTRSRLEAFVEQVKTRYGKKKAELN
ncbi:MAG: Activator of (R)-2-hydroxyglutaryl-CoA dehydratase [Candidatus Saccharicenans subterraneus]|uniref:Activator of (R)-2-hydroxyglutaryl-CoA dehydratase n=1 Tax=Candidatus Saccharicenans subterraneus TaxID=2508984 RepID=A0A3E2BPA7_9BACT|nr:MAG: Activator of (R)-2-hydroxyglutaryl-CoA dehydratase [Candidatus Saccharicenans subterraneum]